MRLLACLSVLALTAAPAAAEPDARAVAVGKQLWSALGGDDGWNHARYLRYDFVVEKEGKKLVTRAHYWDRWSGRYRVDAQDKVGPTTVYLDVNTKKGDAFAAGAKITDAARAGRRRRGLRGVHQRHVLAARALQGVRPGRHARPRRRGEERRR
jgi:hypothetical protein